MAPVGKSLNTGNIVVDDSLFITSFNADGSLFAVVDRSGASASSRDRSDSIVIWDTLSNTVKCRYIPTSDTLLAVSCASWGRIYASLVSSSAGGGGQSKKRKKDSDIGSGDTIEVLALGTDSSNAIHFFSPAHGSIVYSAGIQSSSVAGSISDIAFVNNGSSIYASTTTGMVFELTSGHNLKGKGSKIAMTVSEPWRAEKGPVTRISYDGSQGLLATAGESIKLWDMQSRQQKKAFIGYASSVSQLVFASHEKQFISASLEDRGINVWRDNGKSFILNCPENFKKISYGSGGFVCATQDNKVCFWTRPLLTTVAGEKKKKVKTRVPDSIVDFRSESGGQTIPVIDLSFSPQGLWLARGSVLRPAFEQFELYDSDQELKSGSQIRSSNESMLISESNDSFSSFEKGSSVAQSGEVDNRAVAVAGASEVPIAKSSHAQVMEVTIEEKLNALKMIESDKPKMNVTGGEADLPKVDSCLNMLTQALHSEDKQLMEECLRIRNDRVIRNTVQQMPSKYVFPFFDQLTSRFRDNPNRAGSLLKWLRAILVAHMSFLVSHPQLSEKLAPLYQTIDSRLQSFGSVLRVHGRLEVLCEQVKLRAKVAANPEEQDILSTPVFMYGNAKADGDQMPDEGMISDDDSENEQ